MFQFPTNGKVHVNSLLFVLIFESLKEVSIPYERESTCELKHLIEFAELMRHKFQFPTNGKVHVNS